MSSRRKTQSERDYMKGSDELIRDGNEFDPESSVLNYMTWTIVSYATQNRFSPPFRLLLTDANLSVLQKSILRVKKGELREHITFEGSGEFQAPFGCKLTDREGRKHEIVVSLEEIKSWMDEATASGSRYIRFPAKIPNEAPEVFLTLRQMLTASCLGGFEPPFVIEVRDARGELFDTTQIFADEEGEFWGGRHICNCAHLRFPVTIKLISQSGAGFMATVQRQC